MIFGQQCVHEANIKLEEPLTDEWVGSQWSQPTPS